MKRIAVATSLALALLAAPVAQAASPHDRAMATGAVVGATTGAVVGSASHQAFQGAVIGAVFGTIAGAVLASNDNGPVYVAPRREHVRRMIYVRPYHHRRAYYHGRERFDRDD